jgi:hypothetical protein
MRNAIVFGWNRSTPGREHTSNAHFGEFSGYLGALQKEGKISGFDVVFIEPTGSNRNGFFVIKGAPKDLDAVQGSEVWQEHMTRASLHLEDVFSVRASINEGVMQLMQLWGKHLPK